MRIPISSRTPVFAAVALPAFFLLALFSSADAAAQGADNQGPVIQEIRIGVQDLSNRQKLEQLPGGGTLHMAVGDRVRLRMVAYPAGRSRAPRYPSTKFWALAGDKRIRLTNIDHKVGSVDVEAISTRHAGNNQATTLIAFEILDDLKFVKPSMAGGTITVEVTEPEPERPSLPIRPDRPDGPDRDRGITLYEHQDFRGVSENFTSDVRDLRGTRIGPDRTSSLMLSRGCRAVLFEHPDFQGHSTVVDGPVEDLRGSRVGNDTLSSFRLECGRPGSEPDRRAGITVFEHQNFRGDSDSFTTDVRDLRGTRIGPDRASSLTLSRGCVAILYEHPNFEGRSSYVDGPVEDLNGSRVGNDTLSAIRLDCSGRGLDRYRDDSGFGHDRRPVDRRGVTLYDDAGYRGTSQSFSSSERDLRGSRVGDDRARSVRVDPGCRAILYTGPDYRGDSLVVDRDEPDLSRTRIGFDSITSLEVDCRR